MADDFRVPAGAWINQRNRFAIPTKANLEPAVDKLVSEVVGKKVYALDPRLLSLVMKWKKQANKSPEDNTPDNFLRDPAKIAELRETFK